MVVNMGRTRVHDEATAAALLQAAEKIAETEGLQALTVRRVAEKTGTTTRATGQLPTAQNSQLPAATNTQQPRSLPDQNGSARPQRAG